MQRGGANIKRTVSEQGRADRYQRQLPGHGKRQPKAQSQHGSVQTSLKTLPSLPVDGSRLKTSQEKGPKTPGPWMHGKHVTGELALSAGSSTSMSPTSFTTCSSSSRRVGLAFSPSPDTMHTHACPRGLTYKVMFKVIFYVWGGGGCERAHAPERMYAWCTCMKDPTEA